MREVLEHLELLSPERGKIMRETLERWRDMLWKCEDQCERYVDCPVDNCTHKLCWLYEMKIQRDALRQEIEEALK